MSTTAYLTALDVADEFVRRYHDIVRFEPTTKGWLVFDARRGWCRDDNLVEVQDLLTSALRDLKSIVPEDVSSLEARRFTKTRQSSLRRLENQGSITSILTLASRHRALQVTADCIDARRDVFVAPNRVIDLRTGSSRTHQREHVALRRTGIDFDPAAGCPRFERFLDEVLGTDADVRAYRQPWLGYLLTGETRQHQMWLLTGAGSNGKSTLLHVLQRVLRSYAQQAAESVVLAAATTGTATPELTRLRDVRLAVLSETGHGQNLNESRVKSLVSGDPVTARPLYGDFVEFEPVAKFLLATNTLPVVHGTDHGIWRRLVVVPFGATFDLDADPTLAADLAAESAGILAWLVRGAVAYYANGLPDVPAAWRAATQSYRNASDPVGAFLAEHCELKAGVSVGATELYDAYCRDAEEKDLDVLTQSEFGRRLSTVPGVTKGRHGKANLHYYFGLRLVPTGLASAVPQTLHDIDDFVPTVSPHLRAPHHSPRTVLAGR